MRLRMRVSSLEVADAVLEAHEIGIAFAELGQSLIGEDGVVAVVDDDADRHGLAHFLDVRGKTCLLRVNEIRRQKQQTIRAALTTAPTSDGFSEKNSPVPPAANNPATSCSSSHEQCWR